MRKIFRLILGCIVLTEIIVAIAFGIKLYREKGKLKTLLGQYTLVPVRKDSLLFSASEKLPNFYEPKPNSKITEQPDWLGHEVTSTINADGLNNQSNYSVEKSKDVFRIIAVGDSCTYGQYVNTRESWPERLEYLLNSQCGGHLKYEVLNLGVAGYDVQYITRRYEIRGKKYNPDLIVWFEPGTGLNRTRELMAIYTDKYDKELTQKDIDMYKSKGEFYPAWSLAIQEIHKKYGDDEILSLIQPWYQDFFRIRGSVPVIITKLPDVDPKGKLLEWTKGERDISIVPVSDFSDPKTRLADGHPNALGHDRIASDTLNYLMRSNIVSCK